MVLVRLDERVGNTIYGMVVASLRRRRLLLLRRLVGSGARWPSALIVRSILSWAGRLLLLQRLVSDACRLLALLDRLIGRRPLLICALLQLIRQRLSTTLLQKKLMRRPVHLLARHVQRFLHLSRRVSDKVRVAVLA